MVIENTFVNLTMGISDDWNKLEGLTLENINTLNEIGVGHEKRYGKGAIGLETYLNNIAGKSIKYKVETMSFDRFKFTEKLLITTVIGTKITKKKIFSFEFETGERYTDGNEVLEIVGFDDNCIVFDNNIKLIIANPLSKLRKLS
ncbi:hypothetical protein O0R52_21990 (plasmid) [Bacillus halotolerans]|uniref:Uncharacterized protein n=1 Tax=Bacillus halotolerans TaxID=260554 RepID=A0ABY7I639_9BACI|nr:hypothetical protein [Bacillus halotolerans]WAT23454.1 hypothetical protein O0R52_21990 [Bacillus halotolerans]